MLTDDAQNSRQIPTKQNIVCCTSLYVSSLRLIRSSQLQAMQWLVRDAQPNDSLFFHCKLAGTSHHRVLQLTCNDLDSGHGGQTKDVDGDEGDGYDETIYPVDFKQSGHIVDDVSMDNRVQPLYRILMLRIP